MTLPNPSQDGPFPRGLFRTPIMAAMITGVLAGMINQIPTVSIQFKLVAFEHYFSLWGVCEWLSYTLVLCAPFWVFRKGKVLLYAPLIAAFLTMVSIGPSLLIQFLPIAWYSYETLSIIMWILTPILLTLNTSIMSLYLALVYGARPIKPCLLFGLLGGLAPLLLFGFSSAYFYKSESNTLTADTIIAFLFAVSLMHMIWFTVPAWKIESLLREQYRKEKSAVPQA